MNSQRVATVDIGSNSVLLLIAERNTENDWRRVCDFVDITRVSEGMDATGILQPEPIERTRTALVRFVRRAREGYGVEAVSLVGTAPFRRAMNGSNTAELLGDSVGIPLRILSGKEEARLVTLASRKAFPRIRPTVLIDVGGASSEIVFQSDEHDDFVSLDLGSVRLFERVNHKKTSKGHLAYAQHIAEQEFEQLSTWNSDMKSLIGVAGTVTSLAMVDQERTTWDHEAIHGHVLSRNRLEDIMNQLFSMTISERRNHPSIEEKRADVLPYGAVVLTTVMRLLDVETLVVSDHGLRWGALYEQYG